MTNNDREEETDSLAEFIAEQEEEANRLEAEEKRRYIEEIQSSHADSQELEEQVKSKKNAQQKEEFMRTKNMINFKIDCFLLLTCSSTPGTLFCFIMAFYKNSDRCSFLQSNTIASFQDDCNAKMKLK